MTVNAQSSAAPVAGVGTPRRAVEPAGGPRDRQVRDRDAGLASSAPICRCAGARGDVDEFDAALIQGAGGMPVEAGGGSADGGVATTSEHLSEREIEDEAEAEGDLSEDEIQEIAGRRGVVETVALPLRAGLGRSTAGRQPRDRLPARQLGRATAGTVA